MVNLKPKFLNQTLIVLLFIFIGNSVNSQNINNEKIYYKPLPNLALVFDPPLIEDTYSLHIAQQIYDPLFKFGDFSEIKPNLLSKFIASTDGTKYTLTLKPDIKFHDGKPLTTDDVIFTIQYFIKKSPQRYPELLFIKGAQEFLSNRSVSIRGLSSRRKKGSPTRPGRN